MLKSAASDKRWYVNVFISGGQNLATDYHNGVSMFKFWQKDVLVFSIGVCLE